MDRSIDNLVDKLISDSSRVLEIGADLWKSAGFHDYHFVLYPEFDLCTDVLDRKFDIIIAEQVFEHLKYPSRAASNVYKMLAPGGVLIISTPFLIKYHPTPIDCSRWTAEGLKNLLHESGFELPNIEVFSWGNKPCAIENFDSWVKFMPKIHSLDNDEEYPIVVWGMARK